MKMTPEERKKLENGEPEPDIVKEAKAVVACLLLIVCAIIVVGAVCGMFWLITAIIK